MFVNVYFCFNVFFEVFFSGYGYVDSVTLFVDFLSLGKFVYNCGCVVIRVVKWQKRKGFKKCCIISKKVKGKEVKRWGMCFGFSKLRF
jgi:hypothetical protein